MGLYAQPGEIITMYGVVCSTRGDNSNVWDCMVENHLIGLLSESHQYFKKEVTIIFNFFID